ncbi:MAG TPA: MBOAT family protein [Methylomirabilota bacterium]
MIFNSIQFVVFFVVVYSLYRLLPHRPQNVLLLVASYVFYGAWDWRFLGLLAASTIIDYFIARYLGRTADPRRRTRVLWISIAFNLGVLGFFKYFGFFTENLRLLLSGIGLEVSPPMLHVLLPIGISFYTFMTMSYVIDVYRRHIEPTTDFIDFAVFVAYFPHLVAGPILRAASLIPQIARPRRPTAAQIQTGLWLVGWGLFKKVFVADNLGHVADEVFAPGRSPSGPEVLIGTYAFAFQIYGDFSGYSDIAIGISKLMGIDLNINFRFPYFVRSPQAFWRHWHISLSTWLRDYLYIPLGGNRKGEGRMYLNLMITMLLGGLWHGAAWPFVIWGAYQGALLVVYRLARGGMPERWHGALDQPALRVLGWLLMFHLTCYGWLIFRAASAGQIAALTGQLFAAWGGPLPVHELQLLAFYTLPLLLVHGWEAWKDDLAAVPALPLVPRYAIYVALAYFTVLFGEFAGSQFIYFQF